MQVKFYNVFYNFYFICINLKKFFQLYIQYYYIVLQRTFTINVFTKCSFTGFSKLRKVRPFDIPVSQDLFQSSDNEHFFGVISHRRRAVLIPLLGCHGSTRDSTRVSHLYHCNLCTGSSCIVLHYLLKAEVVCRDWQLLRHCR